MTIPFCLLACLLFCSISSYPQNAEFKYSGAQVFRVTPSKSQHVNILRGLHTSDDFDFWTDALIIGHPVDIMASRWRVPILKEILRKSEISYDVMIPDLEQLIVEQREENKKALAEEKNMGWTAYHDYDEIMDWVDSLAKTYPSLVTVEDVGKSYEGRTMKIVKVSTGGTGKPAIFSDAGIHAREWIAPATLTYIMNELLSNQKKYADVLDAVDFYFMPSINPDGYAYSWSENRMWRKTRSPTKSSRCMGTDANRNWDFHWMESGASQNACSETYAGPKPFSEVETQVVQKQMLKYSDAAQVYLTFHSYGQYWLYPWGYDSSFPADWRDLDDLGRRATDALRKVYGTRYSLGGSGSILYPAAGASDDYAKGVGGIKYVYTVELRDTGRYGFVLPPNQIIPTGEETFEAFRVVMEHIRDTYGKK